MTPFKWIKAKVFGDPLFFVDVAPGRAPHPRRIADDLDAHRAPR